MVKFGQLLAPPLGKLSLLNTQSFANGSGNCVIGQKTKALRVVVVGGGGGGGCFVGDIPGISGSGSGGGSGGVAIKLIAGDDLRDSYSYSVGAFGRGGSQISDESPPTPGGLSSFTADNLTLHGAAGVAGKNAGIAGSGWLAGGWGGGFLNGDDNIRGDTGSHGNATMVLPIGYAFGGASPVDDTRATTAGYNVDVPAATGYGGGGAPAIGNNHVSIFKGGNGGGGFIFVAEYG